MQKRWKYENELKYSPKPESRDREIEFAFTCNSGCYAPSPTQEACLYFLVEMKLVSVCALGLFTRHSEKSQKFQNFLLPSTSQYIPSTYTQSFTTNPVHTWYSTVLHQYILCYCTGPPTMYWLLSGTDKVQKVLASTCKYILSLEIVSLSLYMAAHNGI